jgi:uncharacterized phage-associated protein
MTHSEPKTEGFSAKALANWFIERGLKEEKPVDHMKLHKLLYFAHGWYLALAAKPLMTNEYIEAWKYGPVVPSIYHEFKKFRSKPIDRHAMKIVRLGPDEFEPQIPRLKDEATTEEEYKSVSEFLEAIWSRYSEKSAIELSQMTHQADTPWMRVRRESAGRENADIRDDVIREYFGRYVVTK